MLLLSSGAVAAAPLDQAGRTEILTNAARLIETRYVDPANGARIAAALLNARGKWADVTDPKQFAEQVTRWLRRVPSDGQLGRRYSEGSRTAARRVGKECGSTGRSRRAQWY